MEGLIEFLKIKEDITQKLNFIRQSQWPDVATKFVQWPDVLECKTECGQTRTAEMQLLQKSLNLSLIHI